MSSRTFDESNDISDMVSKLRNGVWIKRVLLRKDFSIWLTHIICVTHIICDIWKISNIFQLILRYIVLNYRKSESSKIDFFRNSPIVPHVSFKNGHFSKFSNSTPSFLCFCLNLNPISVGWISEPFGVWFSSRNMRG